MRYLKLFGLAAAVIMMIIAGCERKVTNENNNTVTEGAANFVGSEACMTCHADTYDSFIKSGHPYKLNDAALVEAGNHYPDFVTELQIPADLSWDDIGLIIGGYWWKARYIEPVDGAIYIGPDRQFNLATEEFVSYDGSTPGFKDYNCGPCHTTGYQSEGNQDGKDSLIGTWAYNGIQCEECHGRGEFHVDAPYKYEMTVDRTAAQCGQCHIRGPVDEIPGSGGFVKHHEQYNEMHATKHLAIDCVDCHDPHIGLHPNNPERGNAIVNKCEDGKCHLDAQQSFADTPINEHRAGAPGAPTCIDCHMPKAGKSAIGDLSTFTGDIRSHLWVINTDAAATMWNADSTKANPYLTLDYTCLHCHTDKDITWAATYAESIHASTPGVAEYIGSEACSACHPTTYANFRNSGHPYKLNDSDSAQLPLGEYYPYTSVPLPGDLTADDITMVIGGFRWKARYIDNEGYILTGADRQYNFATDEFVSYDAATEPRKPYACGPCHMTDYEPTGNQNGLPGLVGTWAFNGVQCEECHGAGSIHASDAYNVDMIVDRTSEQCGKCHVRGNPAEIPASGGFIKHHEQWNEMFTTKHMALDCVDCHDPHMGLHEDNPDRALAIKTQCESCHFAETASFIATSITDHISDPDGPSCIECHMPFAAKSAVGDLATFTGDVRSHLWRINTDSTAQMFNGAGTLANGYLTVEYSCLRCHDGETKQWASLNAANAHNSSVAPHEPDVDVKKFSSKW